jgi:hypothetical protein
METKIVTARVRSVMMFSFAPWVRLGSQTRLLQIYPIASGRFTLCLQKACLANPEIHPTWSQLL